MISLKIKSIAGQISKQYSPFYLIDLDAIQYKTIQFQNEWRKRFPNFKFAYSYKTNALKAVTQLLRLNGASAEIVSWTEGKWALEDGHQGHDIFFDGPFKHSDELEQAITHSARIQLDSIEETKNFISLCKKLGKTTRISCRLSTSYRGLKKSRFGFTPNEFSEALSMLNQNQLYLSGVHLHVGSNLNHTDMYVTALREYSSEIRRVIENIPNNELGWIDIGGGYPAKSLKNGAAPILISTFVEAIYNCFLSDLSIEPSSIELVTEPGRSLVEDHGYFITTIALEKVRDVKNLLVLDAGTNFLRSIGNWHHPVEELAIRSHSSIGKKYDVYGSNCFESDLFYADWDCGQPAIGTGDKIIIGSAGGYDVPSTNVWTRPLPPIFGVKEGKPYLIRKPQSSEEIRNLQLNFDKIEPVISYE